jgi:hypothetical protein
VSRKNLQKMAQNTISYRRIHSEYIPLLSNHFNHFFLTLAYLYDVVRTEVEAQDQAAVIGNLRLAASRHVSGLVLNAILVVGECSMRVAMISSKKGVTAGFPRTPNPKKQVMDK